MHYNKLINNQTGNAMRTPSIKSLRTIFGDNAKEAKKILLMHRNDLTALNSSQRLQRDSYGIVSTVVLRMQALNDLGGFHGIEGLESNKGYASYLNAGDPYADTLIRWNGNYWITTVGDFVEVKERNGVKFL